MIVLPVHALHYDLSRLKRRLRVPGFSANTATSGDEQAEKNTPRTTNTLHPLKKTGQEPPFIQCLYLISVELQHLCRIYIYIQVVTPLSSVTFFQCKSQVIGSMQL